MRGKELIFLSGVPKGCTAGELVSIFSKLGYRIRVCHQPVECLPADSILDSGYCLIKPETACQYKKFFSSSILVSRAEGWSSKLISLEQNYIRRTARTTSEEFWSNAYLFTSKKGKSKISWKTGLVLSKNCMFLNRTNSQVQKGINPRNHIQWCLKHLLMTWLRILLI